MKHLPTKPNQKQELIIEAVKDFFGDNKESKKSITRISLWLLGERKGIVLDKEEKEALDMIRNNL